MDTPTTTPLTLPAIQHLTDLTSFYTWLHDRASATSAIFISLTPLPRLLSRLTHLASSDPARNLPLHGVPYVLKDNIDAPPHPTTAACELYSYMPMLPAYAVTLIESAGGVCVGKVNMDQFACGLVGTRSPYGTPQNLCNAQYVPGGSSSGSAVAVASGLCVFAIGTDTAGSGRVPAAMNGLVGFKPTRGLISTRGVVPAVERLDCLSVFTAAVEDAATVLRVLVKEDEECVWSRALKGGIGGVRGFEGEAFRFGVPAGNDLVFDGDEVAERSFWAAVEILERLGGRKVEVGFGGFKRVAGLLYGGGFVAERFEAVGEFIKSKREHAEEGFDEIVSGIISKGEEVAGWKLVRDLRTVMEEVKKADREVWQGVEVVVVPTVPRPVKLVEVEREPVTVNSMLGTYTNFVNLMDYCAVAVPAPRVEGQTVPMGITIVAKAFEDNLLLKMGHAFEKATQGKV